MIRRRTVILLGAAALVTTLGATAAVVVRTAETRTGVDVERPYPTLAARAGDVSRVAVQRAEGSSVGTVTLERTGDGWILKERDGYPVRTDLVRKLLFDLGQIELIERKTADADRASRLELRDVGTKGSKAARVVVTAANGDTLVDLHVGKRRESLSGGKPMVYVRRSGEAQTYLAEGELDLRGGPVQWLLREIVNIPKATIATATLTSPQGATLRLERAGEDFKIIGLPADRKVNSQYSVNNAATVIDKLLFDDVRSAKGLDFGTGQGGAVFTTTDGLTVTLEFAPDPAATGQPTDPQPWLRAGIRIASDATEDAKSLGEAARARTEGWAYRASSYDLERLRATLESLTKPAEGS